MKVISAVKARTNFGGVINEAVRNRSIFLVERQSLPVLVLMSVPEYESLTGKNIASHEENDGAEDFSGEDGRV